MPSESPEPVQSPEVKPDTISSRVDEAIEIAYEIHDERLGLTTQGQQMWAMVVVLRDVQAMARQKGV